MFDQRSSLVSHSNITDITESIIKPQRSMNPCSSSVIKEGEILKYTNIALRWQKRWVVIRTTQNSGSILSYYINEDEPVDQPRGWIPLEKAVVTIDAKYSKRFTVTLDGTSFAFEAETADDCDAWVHALTPLQEQSNNLNSGEDWLVVAEELDDKANQDTLYVFSAIAGDEDNKLILQALPANGSDNGIVRVTLTWNELLQCSRNLVSLKVLNDDQLPDLVVKESVKEKLQNVFSSQIRSSKVDKVSLYLRELAGLVSHSLILELFFLQNVEGSQLTVALSKHQQGLAHGELAERKTRLATFLAESDPSVELETTEIQEIFDREDSLLDLIISAQKEYTTVVNGPLEQEIKVIAKKLTTALHKEEKASAQETLDNNKLMVLNVKINCYRERRDFVKRICKKAEVRMEHCPANKELQKMLKKRVATLNAESKKLMTNFFRATLQYIHYRMTMLRAQVKEHDEQLFDLIDTRCLEKTVLEEMLDQGMELSNRLEDKTKEYYELKDDVARDEIAGMQAQHKRAKPERKKEISSTLTDLRKKLSSLRNAKHKALKNIDLAREDRKQRYDRFILHIKPKLLRQQYTTEEERAKVTAEEAVKAAEQRIIRKSQMERTQSPDHCHRHKSNQNAPSQQVSAAVQAAQKRVRAAKYNRSLLPLKPSVLSPETARRSRKLDTSWWEKSLRNDMYGNHQSAEEMSRAAEDRLKAKSKSSIPRKVEKSTTIDELPPPPSPLLSANDCDELPAPPSFLLGKADDDDIASSCPSSANPSDPSSPNSPGIILNPSSNSGVANPFQFLSSFFGSSKSPQPKELELVADALPPPPPLPTADPTANDLCKEIENNPDSIPQVGPPPPPPPPPPPTPQLKAVQPPPPPPLPNFSDQRKKSPDTSNPDIPDISTAAIPPPPPLPTFGKCTPYRSSKPEANPTAASPNSLAKHQQDTPPDIMAMLQNSFLQRRSMIETDSDEEDDDNHTSSWD